LQEELKRRRRRFQTNDESLPGSPDIVFPRKRLVVFCDGDFWHGRRLNTRLLRLRAGHNAHYWTAKILGNVRRDRRIRRELRAAGWTVLRLWDSDIQADVAKQADKIEALLRRAD
jgi:DNA mismatch endonuclease (patch repair protein)